MKSYLYKEKHGIGTSVNIVLDKYVADNSLAIQLVDAKDGMPYAMLTVCLEHPKYKLLENQAFIDTNNLPGAEKFIIANGLGKPTGLYETSGFCEYPCYEFDLEQLKK